MRTGGNEKINILDIGVKGKDIGIETPNTYKRENRTGKDRITWALKHETYSIIILIIVKDIIDSIFVLPNHREGNKIHFVTSGESNSIPGADNISGIWIRITHPSTVIGNPKIIVVRKIMIDVGRVNIAII